MTPGLTQYGFSPKIVEPYGSGSNRVLICGESPGESEDQNGVPFFPYAQAGSLLERVLRRCGVSRDQFTITNVVWQRPPNNYLEGASYEQEAVEFYRQPLDDLIEARKPKVIIALGNIPLKRFTGFGGSGATITSVSGYVLNCTEHDSFVIPGPHPAWIMRGKQDYTGFLIWIIKRALQIVEKGFERRPLRYVTNPSVEDALEFEREWLNSGPLPLSYDIETPESDKLDEEEVEEMEGISSHIIRASFSFQEGHAISMVWQEPFITIMKRMLATPTPKRDWNGRGFDRPRLAYNGAPVNGRVYDFMDLWKHLQPTLRRSLGFVAPFYGWDHDPWKHLSWTDPAFYSCADADATTRIANGVTRDLRSINLWETLERHVVDLSETLEDMKRNGLPVDVDALEEMRVDLTAKKEEREEATQKLAPISIRPIHPKAGYVRVPKDTSGMIQQEFVVKGEKVIRWVRVEPFNPGSPKQISAYCKLKHYPLGTNRKTKKETTDEDTLKRLVKRYKDPLLKTTLEYRKLDKVLGTYIAGWTPGPDGCVHATPGFWGKMYRISWRRPNLSATIQDKDEEEIAAGFRKCIKAPEGFKLVEVDWSGIEAVLTGWFAGDADYIRLARIGVHSFLLSHLLGQPVDLSLPDAELSKIFKGLKKENKKRYDDAKHCVHGSNYGMGPYLMAAQYGMTNSEAARLQKLYFDLFPKIKKWQDLTIEQAHQNASLKTPFGYPMWFWDVYRWDTKKKGFVRGEDAKSAISFLPRDTAAAMLREVILDLKDLANSEVRILRGSIHDSILGLVPDPRVIEIAKRIKGSMEREWVQLGGLSIGTEVKIGQAWDEESMEVVLI